MQRDDENLPFSPIDISIGYEYSTSSYGVMESLLNEADAKMYKNKKMKKTLLTSKDRLASLGNYIGGNLLKRKTGILLLSRRSNRHCRVT